MRNNHGQICDDIGDLFTACCIGISQNGERKISTFNCEEDSVFDCASITKSMPTAYLALKAIESKLLSIDTPIADILPDFKNKGNIFHLLTHSLDYRFPMSSLKNLTPLEIWQRICSHKFEIPPGQLFNYGNANSILLGKILENIHKMPLDKLAKEKVFEPLKMQNTGWHPLEWTSADSIIPSEICPWRSRELRGETHDESAWVLEKEFGAVGSAGVFSTVPDILTFLEHILESEFLLEKLTKNAFQNGNDCTALGFELNNPKFMGEIKKGEAIFGKTGFTGTSFICKPQSKLCLVILSNYTYPHRKPNADRINEFRVKVKKLTSAFHSI
ncbi:MAG: beta-lactamase family protein [Fibromonadaceae bacterium]|jgi:CubicO group peptidase (beta-lactamase class C family)|nr:beta-lactamase family protein [Fibromonadaceae bacterium]